MSWTTIDIKNAVLRISAACDNSKDFLCEADSKLGDGDLGITMQKGWHQIAIDSEKWDTNISTVFIQMAKSLQSACASSYGTLLATGFMAMAKYCKSESLKVLEAQHISPLLKSSYVAMMHRGKGELGQKSVLDVLAALENTFEDLSDNKNLKMKAQHTIKQTLNEFSTKPNLLGRARMFNDKSIGIDDPGMLAIQVIVDAI